jgi:hypothetical protein
VAEEFLIGDFVRSGLLDPGTPMVATGYVNESPFRTIPAVIYNDLPEDLKAIIGGPSGNVTEDVPIYTDGNAMILRLARTVPRQAETREQDFVINFGQVIPKPFCSNGPSDYVYAEGPVHLKQTVRLTPGGVYEMSFHALGTLSVTPVNPLTGEPLAEPFTAHVRERYSSLMNNRYAMASSLQFQKLVPSNVPGAGQLFRMLLWDSRGHNGFSEDVRCAPVSHLASNTGNCNHRDGQAQDIPSGAVAVSYR